MHPQSYAELPFLLSLEDMKNAQSEVSQTIEEMRSRVFGSKSPSEDRAAGSAKKEDKSASDSVIPDRKGAEPAGAELNGLASGSPDVKAAEPKIQSSSPPPSTFTEGEALTLKRAKEPSSTSP